MPFSFSPFPRLTTQRLLLRKMTLKDVGEIFLIRTDPIVNKHLNRPKAASIDDATAFIKRINAGIENNQSLFWGIGFIGENKLVGTICLWNFSAKENKAETGYELLPSFHGKAIMQEAVSKVLEFGFGTLQLTSIEARTVKQNESSIKILERNRFNRAPDLESRIDRQSEGPDTIIYLLSRANYLNSRS